MKRGEIYLIAGEAGPAGKPRPCLVVQRSSTLAGSPKVTICPITSGVRLANPIRPLIHPSEANGLISISQVEIDWIYTYRLSRFGRCLGKIDDATMRQVDLALQRWLDL